MILEMRRHLANESSSNGVSSDGHSDDVSVRRERAALDNGRSESAKTCSVVTKTKSCGAVRQCLFRTLVPLFLMFFSPNLVVLLWYTAAKCRGSFFVLFDRLTSDGIYEGVTKIWLDIHIASPLSVAIIVGYLLWALVLMIVVPGPQSQGPVTPNGNVPIYKDNGFTCYVITMVAFWMVAIGLKLVTPYSVTIVYDHFDECLGTLTVFSHVLCFFLHLKGLVMPSTSDCGTSGNVVFDYYWGTELYPRVFGVDIKVFTNCRFGMTVWALLVCVFALKNYELYGFVDGPWVSAALQLIYFTKFFWWESGYMNTIDIMLDRAGFYICWGCLAYIPGLYASVSMYFADQSADLGWVLSTAIFSLGLLCCAVNYLADKQKLDVRRTNGQCLIWGRRAEVIRAEYRLENGQMKTSILLVSGYWGIARHFHYIPELGLAFLWSSPAMFRHVMPYSYFIWLVILLIHRTFRDDTKCSHKYGKYWDEYCRRVPYKIIPYLF